MLLGSPASRYSFRTSVIWLPIPRPRKVTWKDKAYSDSSSKSNHPRSKVMLTLRWFAPIDSLVSLGDCEKGLFVSFPETPETVILFWVSLVSLLFKNWINVSSIKKSICLVPNYRITQAFQWKIRTKPVCPSCLLGTLMYYQFQLFRTLSRLSHSVLQVAWVSFLPVTFLFTVGHCFRPSSGCPCWGFLCGDRLCFLWEPEALPFEWMIMPGPPDNGVIRSKVCCFISFVPSNLVLHFQLLKTLKINLHQLG